MTKARLKNISDFIPVIILTVSAIDLVWTVATSDIVFMWKHIVALCLLSITLLTFAWRHKVGVLTICLTLTLGLFGLLSFAPAGAIYTWAIGADSDSYITVFYGQPIFLLWLVIHFIVSGRHYVGILTISYWKQLIATTAHHKSAGKKPLQAT